MKLYSAGKGFCRKLKIYGLSTDWLGWEREENYIYRENTVKIQKATLCPFLRYIFLVASLYCSSDTIPSSSCKILCSLFLLFLGLVIQDWRSTNRRLNFLKKKGSTPNSTPRKTGGQGAHQLNKNSSKEISVRGEEQSTPQPPIPSSVTFGFGNYFLPFLLGLKDGTLYGRIQRQNYQNFFCSLIPSWRKCFLTCSLLSI